MRDILVDIQAKLREVAYQNEEHVRLSLVARVLQALGWDVWDPRQVNAEFAPVRSEDNTKVDFALFSTSRVPSVFIEVKAVGKISDLKQIERQLRDYNKNITAPFCVITNGSIWRFYLSQTGGEFANKCFKILDLSLGNAEDAEAALQTFLGKSAIDSGQAEKEAKALLDLTQKERAMEECLPQARRRIQDPPYPSLPDALVSLVAQQGFQITRQEAEDFIASIRPPPPPPPPPEDEIELDPKNPGSLKHTSVIEGDLGERHDNSWNGLVRCGVSIAWERGHRFSDLRRWMGPPVEEGSVSERGFSPDISSVFMPVPYGAMAFRLV